ncbi:MAG: hypothetical protein JNL67_19645 [Planctomycetaceae bacterium]|nr:hypothetical protein [Planctomycetaceae bacterium]
MRRFVFSSILCLGFCLLALGLVGPNAYGQCPTPAIPACPCPCPPWPSIENVCPPGDGHYYLERGENCGTCGYTYDQLAQVWRYTSKNCVSDCRCVLPAVYKGSGIITTACTKRVLTDREFLLELQVADGAPHTFRFYLPDFDPDTFKYTLELGGRTWNVSVLYQDPVGLQCAPSPSGFPHNLSSTLTTKSFGTFRHAHNDKEGNCKVHAFGDFQVMITLEP